MQMHLLRKSVTIIFVIFLLPGCAMLGSENYFAASTANGKSEWAGDPGISHITGKPDAVRYSRDEIDLKVYSSPLAFRTYSFGPCIPLPLPIIPMFGLDDTEHAGPVKISFYVFQSKRQFKLIEATILADNKSFSPKEIIIYHYDVKAQKYNSSEAFLPVSLNDRSTYSITYDLASLSTAVYELDYTVQDDAGLVYLKDKISFEQDTSTTLVCIP